VGIVDVSPCSVTPSKPVSRSITMLHSLPERSARTWLRLVRRNAVPSVTTALAWLTVSYPTGFDIPKPLSRHFGGTPPHITP
jgi:hypothetical protein